MQYYPVGKELKYQAGRTRGWMEKLAALKLERSASGYPP